MFYFETLWRTARPEKASKNLTLGTVFGAALLIAVALWFLLSLLGLSTELIDKLKAETPIAYIGWAVLLVYVVLLSIPFVPSAEIGLAVMLTLGSSMAIPVYAATILGLCIAYAIGRYARRYRPENEAAQTANVLTVLRERFGEGPLSQRILRFRGLAVILLINMPGNTVVGGGGGIAMAIGYWQPLTFKGFLCCMVIAVAPVPALFLFSNVIGLETWIHAWLGRFL